MEIEITEDDSQFGSTDNNTDCPVARAFTRASNRRCSVGYSMLHTNDREAFIYHLPNYLTEQVRNFVETMGEEKIKPGKYTLTEGVN